MLHTTIARNRGGDGSGIHLGHSPVGLPGGEFPGTLALTNSILVSHTVGITATNGNTVTVDGVLWYGTQITVSVDAAATVSVANQFTGDPVFAVDGYYLMSGSAAIDRGKTTEVTTDIDGEPRGVIPDLGADEFFGHKVYLPIILR